jgi:integrase
VNHLSAADNDWNMAPELPTLARTRSGVEFDPRSDRWIYRDATTYINLDFEGWPTTRTFVTSAKLTCLWYAEHASPSHLKNMHERLRHYLRTVCDGRDEVLAEVSSVDLLNYRSTLTGRTSWYLGSLSGFFQKWHDLGFGCITEDAVALLRQLRIPGNRKGEAVLTHDPVQGPFSDLEVESLQAALDRAYAAGEVDRERYVLAYLFMLLGQRSVQYAALKVRDVGAARAEDGTSVYTLRVPRAKQRDQLSRSEFRDRVLIPQIGQLLVAYCDEVRAKFEGVLPDPSDAPLFPARKRRSKKEPEGFEYHRTSLALRNFLVATLSRLQARSERTGQSMHISSVRFRRTMATRAAIEGHGPLVLAELLDHDDTQNVGVYIEARPEIVERIDRAIAMRLAPLAQAFAGVLIDDESQATRAGDPSSRICNPGADGSIRTVGNCGKFGFCGFFAPIACYTCVNYQPWLDGPHEAVLEHLLSERERLTKEADLRIASINDRTILAVAEVIQLCEVRRKETLHG